jgi:DNA-binding MarR family transcriptional regulator
VTQGRAALDFPSLRELLGFNLRMLDVRMMSAMRSRLEPIGLTPAAATVLLALADQPGLALGQLAEVLVVQKPNMTKLVKRLESQGLVRRAAPAGDRRRIALLLTPEGAARCRRAQTLLAEHDARTSSVLTEAERRKLFAMVGRMLALLERPHPCATDQAAEFDS